MDPEDGNSSSPSGADDMAAPIPYIMRHTIDLTSLTAEEEKIIKDVLAKDAKISELLDSRISAINKEIQTIRKKGALTEKDKNQNVICARCKYKFWPIPIPFTDSGPRCIRCKFRVCKRCRIRQVNKTWLCSLCLKHRQKKVLSGDWLASGENCAGLVGSDLIRASFRDRGGPNRRKRLPQSTSRRAEDAAAVSSSSRGKSKRSSDSGQRRDSYSKALENQKVTVILPRGNAESRAHGPDGDALDAASLHDIHESGDEGDRDSLSSSTCSFSSSHPPSRTDSTNSSRSSRDSSNRMLIAKAGRGDGESNQSYKSGPKTPMHDSRKAALVHTQKAFPSSSPSRKGRSRPEKPREVLPDRRREGGKHVPPDSPGNLSRKDSFEKIYDSNVNRLVEMMTGSAMPEAKESPESSKHQRLLPRPPSDTGKSKECWTQRKVSLSEEYSESLKYVSVDEVGDDVLNEISSNRVRNEEVKTKFQSKSESNSDRLIPCATRIRRLPDVEKARQQTKSVKGLLEGQITETTASKQRSAMPSNIPVPTRSSKNVVNNQTIKGDAITLPKGPSNNLLQLETKKGGLIKPPTNSAKNLSQDQAKKGDANQSRKEIPQCKRSINSSDQPKRETQSINQQSALLAHLRVPGREIPPEIKTALCRQSSNASDTLSIITERSESFGEADSFNNGNSSDDTLHQMIFHESLSEDEEVPTHFEVKAIESNTTPNVKHFDSVFADSNRQSRFEELDDSLSLTSSHFSEIEMERKSAFNFKKQDDKKRPLDQGASAQRFLKDSSDDITVGNTSDDSGFIEHKSIKDQTEVSVAKSKRSTNLGKNNNRLDGGGDGDVVVRKDNHPDSETESESSSSCVELGSGNATLLSLALSHHKAAEHPPHRQLKVFQMLSKSMSESSADMEDETDEAMTRATGNEKSKLENSGKHNDRNDARKDRQPPPGSVITSDTRLESIADESLRDSDSGVTSSSHHSQSNTPEQRSLNNEKGVSQPNYSATDKTSVPAIAVTEETREEDDDIDDLFTKHRQDNSLLGSRSSLRDSRESLYSVYSNAEENYGNVPVTGEIQFHLTYDYQHNVLQVHIKQCKEIAAVDTKHNRSDPYVKTYLLPDKSRTSKRKTKIKRHTLNPAFDESLKYTLSKSELDSRTLWVAVWNSDRFGRNDFLGEVTIPLAYYKFDSSAPIWYLLQERAAPEDTALMTYKGDLYISMKYVPANKVETKKAATSKKSKSKGKAPSGLGEIHVLVKEAKNLTAMRGSSGSNPFCKGYLLPDKAHQSKQKTPVIKKSTNPEWQHILIFEGVDENLLEDHGVELTIWDYEKLSSNDFLGGVRLNLGVGTSKGKPVDWMDGKGEEIEIWQSMIDAPNEWVDAQLSLRSSMGSQNAK